METESAQGQADEVLTGQPAGARAGAAGDWLGFGLIVFMFVGSGLSSLIYQVVWTRLLVLVFGSTTFATATVLAVFMGGLALGSFLAGRKSDHMKRPFLWYGILEGVIGVWALLVPLLFDAAVPLYKTVWQQFHLSVVPFSLLRFVMATAILIVPTTCMGATLPLLSRFVTTSLDFVGRRVGTLYAANTLGAVGGAALGGFVLLPAVGLQATTLISASMNFLLCAGVLLLSPKLEKPGAAASDGKEPAKERLPVPLHVRLTILAFAASGAVAMIYEVGWTRTLLMVIGSSTYAFTVMLSTFLIGIFAGSYLIARQVDRMKEPLAWFALLEFLVCLFGMAAMIEFNYMPWWNLTINSYFPHNAALSLLVRFWLVGLVLFPLTFCLGAIFPIVVKIATRDLEAVGHSVGTLYSANTLGAIVGSFLAGFVLVPLMGVERTLAWASVANLLVGVGLLSMVRGIRPSIKIVCVVATLPVIGWCAQLPDIWDRIVMLSAQMERRRLIRQALVFNSFSQWQQDLHDHFDCMFWKDGTSSTVGVLQTKGPGRQRSLVTNGHVDASDGVDMSTQVLLAAYPLLWRPDAQSVGVIGWGSGVSVGVSTLFPVESVTAVELEPAVISASHFFDHVNLKPAENKLVQVELNDGRNYMLATDRLFDVIISEPSNPWQAGVCNLFTREYFQICRQRLKPGGVFSFWLQTVEIPTENLKEIFAALKSVFPYQAGVMANPGNLVVLASDKPLTLDYKRLDWIVGNTKVASELRKLGLKTANAVLARLETTTSGVAKMVEGAKPNVDDTNKLEYAIGKTYENLFFAGENKKLIQDNSGQPWNDVTFRDIADDKRADILCSVAREALLLGDSTLAEGWGRASLAVARTPEALRVIGISRLQQGKPNDAFEFWNQALALDPNHVETLQTRGMAYNQLGKREEARADFLKVLDREPANAAALYHMAQTYARMTAEPNLNGPRPEISMLAQPDKQPETVYGFLKGLVDKGDFVRRHPDVLYMAGVASYQLNDAKRAEDLMRRYLELAPKSVAGQRMLGSILYSRGKNAEASNWWFSSYLLSKAAAEEVFLQAKSQLKAGNTDMALDLFEKGVELWPADQEVYGILKGISPRNERAARLVASLKMLGMSYQRQLIGGGK